MKKLNYKNMNKLNQTFKINPLYESDGYKPAHKRMLVDNTTKLYGTWIPRSLKYMPGGIDEIMSAGQQLVIRHLHSTFAENFFFTEQRIEKEHPFTNYHTLKSKAMKFVSDISMYIGMEYDGKHFEDLWELGYLPIRIKSLPEGIFTRPNIPHMTFVNTVDGYAWLTLFLETYISKLAWQMPTTATIGYKFRKNANDWVLKTDKENMWLTEFMCHDFHSRGGNPFTSIAAGLGHGLTNKGSDTLNVISASRYYYDEGDDDMPIFSVNASEHSVSCTNIFFYKDKLENGFLDNEIKWYYSFDLPSDGSENNPDYLAIAECLMLRDWLKKYPKNILSYVCDTFDTWKSATHIVSRLKDEIMLRDGKLVLRPDSGDPVDILCGTRWSESPTYSPEDLTSSELGLVEILWDIFGGTINKQGYKVLDTHIGTIYGDSINLDRQVEIYNRLEYKSFASTNVVLGVGSFTYVMLTRDSAGYAAKGSWFEVADKSNLNTEVKKSYNIHKDPITDNGQKRSLKGMLQVINNNPNCNADELLYDGNDDIVVRQEVTNEEETGGLLQVIYENGNFYNQTTLSEIRKRVIF